MGTVIDGNGVHTEIQIGNMLQTLGKNGFYLVNYVGFVSSCSEPSEAQVVCPAFCF